MTARRRSETIAADLRARIRGGEWEPGAPFPGWRDLAPVYGGAVNASRRALALLKAEGLLAPRRGEGTYVADPLPPEGGPSPAARLTAVEDGLTELRRRFDDHERGHR